MTDEVNFKWVFQPKSVAPANLMMVFWDKNKELLNHLNVNV